MATELCWEPRENGRYCKNYKMTNKDKCYVHYEHACGCFNYLAFRFLILLALSLSSYMFYMEHTELVNEQINALREYILQLYKNDKNMIHVYSNTLLIIVSKMKLYILKMLN